MDPGLKNVLWVYLQVACLADLLIILFIRTPLPEISDAASCARRHDHRRGTGAFPVMERGQSVFFLDCGDSSATFEGRCHC